MQNGFILRYYNGPAYVGYWYYIGEIVHVNFVPKHRAYVFYSTNELPKDIVNQISNGIFIKEVSSIFMTFTNTTL